MHIRVASNFAMITETAYSESVKSHRLWNTVNEKYIVGCDAV
jgi:hypothetical protein